MPKWRNVWNVLVAMAAVTALVLILVIAGGARKGTRPNTRDGLLRAFSPVVRSTGRAPTGYTVTFRYRDASARDALIQGEWYFSNPAITSPTTSQGLLPAQWRPGDVATGWPAPSTPDGWPIIRMKKDSATGVWSYTTPLPSGYYNYGFYVNCSLGEAESSPNGATATCHELADPSNPPWTDLPGAGAASVETRSEVFVPADPAFDKVDYAWESPMRPKGLLKDVNYRAVAGASAPGHRGTNFLAIYTPPGYDAHRSRPYPTLYLSPGAASNEVDWTTQGDEANIVDRLIDKRQVAPMVVVSTNTGCPGSYTRVCTPSLGYDQDVLRAVIPYMQSHYDVSTEPSQRAFAGFSYGGYEAGTLLVADSTKFSYFGLFSPCPASVPTPTRSQAAAIRRVRILVGGGLQDSECHVYAVEDVDLLQNLHANARIEFMYGGHDWNVWRRLLHDFLTYVAFKPVRG